MKKGILIGTIIGLLLIGIGGWWWWQNSQTQEKVWFDQKQGQESGGRLEFAVKESTQEAEPTTPSKEEPLSDQEIQQLEQEIDQLLDDLNLEEEPELDFEI